MDFPRFPSHPIPRMIGSLLCSENSIILIKSLSFLGYRIKCERFWDLVDVGHSHLPKALQPTSEEFKKTLPERKGLSYSIPRFVFAYVIFLLMELVAKNNISQQI